MAVLKVQQMAQGKVAWCSKNNRKSEIVIRN